ncbi:MAG: sensor histidine kinase [Chloroflexia bacterium]
MLARTLLALWDAGRTQLRWRLTYSYLLISILALLIIIPAQNVFLGLYSLVAAPTLLDPSVAAGRAADAVQPLVRQGASRQQVAGVLAGLLHGTTRLPLSSGQAGAFGKDPASFAGVRRITLVGSDGRVVASAGDAAPATGEPLPARQQTKLAPLLAQVRSGGCANARPAGGPRADTAACAMTGANGGPGGLLLVESNTDSVAQFQADFGRTVSITLMSAASAVYLLLFAVGGILLIAGGGGYVLSRRLSRRLERLTAATDSLVSGDLSRRVTVDSADEIGRLSTDFNAMAARLEEREAALTAEKNRAEKLLTANRRLVADISHELRMPLVTMRGYLEQLELDHGDHLPVHDLAVIQGEMDRLTTLIEDLFTLARAEAQQLPLNMEPVDAGAIAEHLAETLDPLARRERQIEIVTSLPANLPLVQADRVRLEQVVLNLLQNALRYTLPGGTIAVEGSADDGVVTLAVGGTGVGIPSEELPLVFERFYRSDDSRARESGGAGIGLALVSELTAAMGGRVAVESTPGRGSRFSVALPQAT